MGYGISAVVTLPDRPELIKLAWDFVQACGAVFRCCTNVWNNIILLLQQQLLPAFIVDFGKCFLAVASRLCIVAFGFIKKYDAM